MLFDKGKLEKMSIRAFLPTTNSEEPAQVSDAKEDIYVVQVNPNDATRDQLIHYANRRPMGSSGSDAVHSRTAPTTLQFELLFDGTGVVPPPSELGDVPLVGAIASAIAGPDTFEVQTEIDKFNHVVFDYNSEQHRPRKVLLLWGELALSCVFTSVNFRYTLFRPDGTALRAIANCTVRESQPDCERARRENRNSPDLTHVREVVDGDTLPLIAHRIYGKPDLYLEVARVNKLINFRRLTAGTQLVLPPIDKRVDA